MAKKDAKPKTTSIPKKAATKRVEKGRAPEGGPTVKSERPSGRIEKPTGKIATKRVEKPSSSSKRLPVKPLPGAAPGTPVLKGEDAIKAELEKVKRALKDLDGERRRLTNLAEKHERAFLEEAQRRSQLEKRLDSAGSGSQALEAKVSELRVLMEAKETEREELARKVAVLEKAAGTPSPQLIADQRAKAEAAAETKVRALTNEREGLKTRIKELESTSAAAGDKVRLEKLEEKLMELQIERDSFRERLTDAESQLANIPTGDVVERIKTSLADAERDRDRYRDKVIDLEAQVAAIRGGLPIASTSSGRVNVMELQSRLEEAEREREKAERERDDLEKRVHALKTDLYTRKKTPDAGDKHFCPACGTEMKSVVNSSVHMALCPQCAGVFLAKGEVAAIVAQERELMKKAANGSFFTRIFGGNKA